MRKLLLLFTVTAVACGGHRAAPWRPYKAEYAQEAQIAHYAAIAYDGDIDTLSGAGGTLLGFVRVDSDADARVWSANYGGTHALLIRDDTATFNVGSNCTSTASFGTVDTSCRSVNVTIPERYYAVMRVPVSSWPSLPAELQPRPLPPPGAGELPECSPLPAPPPGCSYTRRDNFGSYNSYRVYLKCGAKFTNVEDPPEQPCGLE